MSMSNEEEIENLNQEVLRFCKAQGIKVFGGMISRGDALKIKNYLNYLKRRKRAAKKRHNKPLELKNLLNECLKLPKE